MQALQEFKMSFLIHQRVRKNMCSAQFCTKIFSVLKSTFRKSRSPAPLYTYQQPWLTIEGLSPFLTLLYLFTILFQMQSKYKIGGNSYNSHRHIQTVRHAKTSNFPNLKKPDHADILQTRTSHIYTHKIRKIYWYSIQHTNKR